MSEHLEQLKEKARRFIAAIGEQDGKTLATMYATGGKFWQVGNKLETAGLHDLDAMADLTPRLFRLFPKGIQFNIVSVTAEGQRVSIEADSTAELQDGRPYSNQYVFVLEFDAAGKVKLFKEYWDTLYAYEHLLSGRADLGEK